MQQYPNSFCQSQGSLKRDKKKVSGDVDILCVLQKSVMSVAIRISFLSREDIINIIHTRDCIFIRCKQESARSPYRKI